MYLQMLIIKYSAINNNGLFNEKYSMKIYWIVDGSLKVRSVKFSGQKMSNGGDLQPPIHLENRFEALMNVGEESPNVTKHGSNQPAANIARNKRLRSSRQRHSAQSAAEPRTLILGDSIIRNISSRTTTTCCFPQATVSDVNKELQNILMKHKTVVTQNTSKTCN